MILFKKDICAQLPDVDKNIQELILSSERTSKSHRDFMSKIPAMHLLEQGGNLDISSILPAQIKIVAWNLERCMDVIGSAELLNKLDPDIVLLSEMDCGMARSQQKNTTKELSKHLKMNYIYGVEFFEMGLGSGFELDYVNDDFNLHGWHGNAILSKAAPKDMALIRLDDHGHWFIQNTDTDADQPRIGGRMAIAAIYPTRNGDICVVTTHLESAGSCAIRQSQMDRMIAAVDIFAAGLPVVIGGDLNSGNNIASRNWRDETFFEAAERHDFTWKYNADGITTRPSRLTRNPDLAMKLDWFTCRNLTGIEPQIIPALDFKGKPLSDHELIMCKFA